MSMELTGIPDQRTSEVGRPMQGGRDLLPYSVFDHDSPRTMTLLPVSGLDGELLDTRLWIRRLHEQVCAHGFQVGYTALQALEIVDGIGALPSVRGPLDGPQERINLLAEVENGVVISHKKNLCGGSDTHPR
jgi:hypothetical protein